MALIPEQHERLLLKFKDEVCQNPSADFTPSIEALAAEFRELENKHFSGAFFMLLTEIYEKDVFSFKRDLLKIRLLGTECKAKHSQRTELLRCLFGIMSLYIQDVCAGIIAMCEQIEDA